MARRDGTRQRILAHLEAHRQPMRGTEIAAALGITPVACRAHMNKLMKQGKVHAIGTKQNYGRKANEYRVGPAPEKIKVVDGAEAYMRKWRRAVTSQFEARV